MVVCVGSLAHTIHPSSRGALRVGTDTEHKLESRSRGDGSQLAVEVLEIIPVAGEGQSCSQCLDGWRIAAVSCSC